MAHYATWRHSKFTGHPRILKKHEDLTVKAIAAIPLPLKIAAGVLVVLLLYKLLSLIAGSALLLIVIFLWLLVLLTIMYELGWINKLAEVPVLSKFLGFLSGRNAQSEPNNVAAETTDPKGKLSPEERDRLFQDGNTLLDGLSGAEAIRSSILQRFIEPAQSNPENPFATQSPMVCAIYEGPRGVGKSTAARATALMMAGCNALDTARMVVIKESDLRSGVYRSAIDLGTKKAIDALNGTLLIDDADWLVPSDNQNRTAGSAGSDVGMAILDIAAQNPKMLFLILTMSSEAAARLRSDSSHLRWLGKLTSREIKFDRLGPDILLDITQQQLATAGWKLDSESTKASLRRLLTEHSDRANNEFDNAEACRRIAEQLIETATNELDETSLQNRSIDTGIIRLVDEEME